MDIGMHKENPVKSSLHSTHFLIVQRCQNAGKPICNVGIFEFWHKVFKRLKKNSHLLAKQFQSICSDYSIISNNRNMISARCKLSNYLITPNCIAHENAGFVHGRREYIYVSNLAQGIISIRQSSLIWQFWIYMYMTTESLCSLIPTSMNTSNVLCWMPHFASLRCPSSVFIAHLESLGIPDIGLS